MIQIDHGHRGGSEARAPSLRVSIIGHFKDNLDEGVRLAGRHLAAYLRSPQIEVQTLDISSLRTPMNLYSFSPHILHFVISPTVQGLMIAKTLSLLVKEAKTIVSAIHPAIPDIKLLRLLKPDIILAQSEDSERRLASLGFRTDFLPNGVDTDRFKPLGEGERVAQRKKLGIPVDAFVLLHLGSIRKERNLGVLSTLQKLDGVQTVVVGREGENVDFAIVRNLVDAGCTVFLRHFPDIERVINMADCYVFPTINRKACIETPLSVLEAIACGLPIVTTRFGALPRIVANMQGVFFVDEESEMIQAVEKLKVAMTRLSGADAQVVSWKAIAERLAAVYHEIVDTGNLSDAFERSTTFDNYEG